MPAESRLITSVRKWVNDQGGKMIKIHQSAMSELGVPDTVIMLPKHGMMMVEFKAKGKKQEPIQEFRIKEINQHGGRAFCADSLDSFKSQINHLTNEPPAGASEDEGV